MKAFIKENLRPEVRGSYYDVDEIEPYYKQILDNISLDDIRDPKTRRMIIIRLCNSKYSPDSILMKNLLIDMFPHLNLKKD